MTMKINKFTILIPTYNRVSTLFHTLKTCLDLDYPDFEIIVSDGNSTDSTAEMVRSLNDKRIQYYKTDSVVDMAANWEFALSKVVSTDFITVLGDDDGILSDALYHGNNLVNKHNVKCVTWEKIDYCWPDHIDPAARNFLNLSLESSYKIVNAKKVAQKAADFKYNYNHLPCLYNSFVSFDIIKKIKTITQNKFFWGTSPDVYSAFANVNFVDRYIFSSRSFSINAASKYSNGTGQFHKKNKISEDKSVQTFYEQIKTKFNSRLIVCPSYTLAVADSMYHAFDQLGGRCIYKPDLRLIVKRAIIEASRQDKERYTANIDAILTIAEKNNISSFAKRIVQQNPWKEPDHTIAFGMKYLKIALHAEAFNIHNVHEAAVFCKNMVHDIKPEYQTFKEHIKNSTFKLLSRILK